VTPPEQQVNVALELERLRGTCEAGFVRVDGQLALLIQRSEQTDKKLDDHEARLDALEKNRWPLPSVAVLVALGSLGVALWQASGR
jgi:cytolysin (calcineurin-like family phosphatase)